MGVPKTNVIMLESVMFPNKYLASNLKGNVYVHAGDDMVNDKECQFQVIMEQNDTIYINAQNKKSSNDDIEIIEDTKYGDDEIVIAQQKDDSSSSDEFNDDISENDDEEDTSS